MDRRRRDYLRLIGVDLYLPRAVPVEQEDDAATASTVASAAVASTPGAASASAAAAVSAPAAASGRAAAVQQRAGSPAAERSTVAPPPAAERTPPEPVATVANVDRLDWEALEQAVAACEACRLCAGRTQTVFGVGDRRADLVIVGEGPGAEEDRRGEPFVGRAGKLLDAMLAAIGRGRERGGVYICNIVKCRPPGNRDPRPDEVVACNGYLRRQIELLEPRVIVALGRVAAQKLLDTQSPLARLRGQAHTYAATQIPVWVTYHPAYLLRAPGEKAKVWQDLKQIRALL